MLVILQVPQPEAIAWAERSGLEGLVGPTSPGGWTALWTEDGGIADVTAGPQPLLAVEELPGAITLLVRTEDGHAHRRSWPGRRGADPADPPRQVAAALAGLFAAEDRRPALEALLDHDLDDVDDLVDGLERLLDLPELRDQPPVRTAVCFRGDHSLAELGASVAGPAYVGPDADGWTTLLPAEQADDRSLELAAGLSGAGRRRDAVVWVWRDDRACGVQVWRRGGPTAVWSWNAAWSTVSADPLADQAEVVAELVRLSPGPVEEDLLRALLRRRWPDGDPLAELASLLGLPDELLDALDRPERFRGRPGVTLLERVPVRRAVLARASGRGLADAPRATRAAWLLYAIGTAVAAVVCLAMAVLSLAVLVTDGAAVDQPSATWQDWLWLVVFAALAAVLVPTARARFRRLSRRP